MGHGRGIYTTDIGKATNRFFSRDKIYRHTTHLRYVVWAWSYVIEYKTTAVGFLGWGFRVFWDIHLRLVYQKWRERKLQRQEVTQVGSHPEGFVYAFMAQFISWSFGYLLSSSEGKIILSILIYLTLTILIQRTHPKKVVKYLNKEKHANTLVTRVWFNKLRYF